MVKGPGTVIHHLSFSDLFDSHCTFFRFGHNFAQPLHLPGDLYFRVQKLNSLSSTNKDFTNAPSQVRRLHMNII